MTRRVAAVELRAAYDRGAEHFRLALRNVPADARSWPTPCSSWAVRELVNHVVGGERRYTLLLRGASTAEVEAMRAIDHIGDDPCAAFEVAHAELSAEFGADGALERVVHHRLGDRLGSDLLLMRVMEYALHGWDLDVAVAGSATIDPGIASLLLAALTTRGELWRGDNVFAAPRFDDEPALPVSDRLLRVTGRG